jgi:predicted permease
LNLGQEKMHSVWQDVRHGLRVLRNSPGFTAVAVLTLALGIAATTTVFSWIDGVALNLIPGASHSRELVALETLDPSGEAVRGSYLNYRDYRDTLKLVAGVAATDECAFSVGAADQQHAQPVWGELVSGNYFAVLGVKPALGRVFSAEEYGERIGANPVAVISHRLWQSQFHGDAGVVGKTIRVNRHELTVIGVAAAEFRGSQRTQIFDLWVPLSMGEELGVLDNLTFRVRAYRNLWIVARLRPDVPIERARAEVAAVARHLSALDPGRLQGFGATLSRYTAEQVTVLKLLRILMAVAVLVLLIVCANVANLLLARSIARQREFGVRLALGARRGRIVQQVMVETLLLATAGSLVGLTMVLWLAEAPLRLIPSVGVPTVVDVGLNGRILMFTVLACVGATLASCLVPVWHLFRTDMNESLKEGGRAGSSGARSHRMRSLLVVTEVALATVALIGAGLFLRSFQKASSTYPGFDKTNVLLARFYVQSGGYTVPELQQFCMRLRERLASAPGVAEVSYADYVPLWAGDGPYTSIAVEGYGPQPGEDLNIRRTVVSPGYFRLLRIPLLEGRDFTDRDDAGTLPAIVVNQTFARRFFGGGNPIGRRVNAWGTWFTVVGLVKDSKYFSPTESPRPYFYASFRQRYGKDSELAFFVRTDGDAAEAASTLRREVAAVDPGATFYAMPLSVFTDVSLFTQKFAASLLAALGLLSLALAAVGLYSVMAYAVSQRTQEVGIRMALGARPGDVIRMVVRQGMTLTVSGVAVGIVVALSASGLVADLLVNVNAADPTIFVGAAIFLGLVALVASYLPARRASSLTPLVALRCE